MSDPQPGANAPAPAPPGGNTPSGAPPASPASPDATKKHRLGDYDLTAKLGQGAMGSVYLAIRVSTGDKVALKILPPNLAQDQEFLERFRREARSASKLSHPNLVSALDVGFADNKYHYIAMEYIDGPNLEVVLKKAGGKLPLPDLLRIANDIANALTEAEKHGIVHRDIKPANILMNSAGVSKLTDLGLSSADKGDQRVTMAGYAVGTPYYISPEQARGERNVDSRSDIYSLGSTLYHLATGTLPFPGNNPVVIMTQHITERAQPACLREPSVPKHFSVLLEKMMSKDPAGRQQNAKELLADLELCAKGETPVLKVIAQPQSRTRPNANAASEAHPPPATTIAPPPTGAPSAPPRTFVERINRMIPIGPVALRLPMFAVFMTLLLLAALYAVITLVLK